MLWFEYKKETNIFCVATFSVALLNIVLNIIFLDRYFNDTRELFQDSGLNYGHVALCNSLIILSISTLLIWGCDNYLKVLKWSVYIMPAFKLAEIIVEFSFLNTILNIREFWYVILQPLPLFVVLVLFIASKLPVKAVVGMCIADYVLFVGKELFYANHGGLCFFEVYGAVEINLLRIALCAMFSLIVMTYRILLKEKSKKVSV